MISFLVVSFVDYAQTGWGNWEEIYKDNFITVQIQFNKSENSCEQGGNQYKYRIRKKGILAKVPYFVNWKYDYIDCDGSVQSCQRSFKIWDKFGGQIDNEIDESLDYVFTAEDVVSYHYDVEASNIEENKSGLKLISKSIDPKSISGNVNIPLGESTKLTINGGALGVGADWVWYSGNCGSTRIGVGRSLVVEPIEATTYFVRAESINDLTKCVQIRINVYKESTMPTNIIGDSVICENTLVPLTIQGGNLGVNAKWIWYENDTSSQKIGAGPTIFVHPAKTTIYFVRAEGLYNSTRFLNHKIKVIELSKDPSSIGVLGKNSICAGEDIELNVIGGELGSDATWLWYEGSCYGKSIATGNKVILSPNYTTKYFVRGGGVCNKTNCASLNIYVNELSKKPASIYKSSTIFKGKKFELIELNGYLGSGAQYKWYKNSCEGKYLGSGKSITLKTRKPTYYYVRAEGLCNSTTCAQTYVVPEKSHKFESIYSSARYKKFLHLGISFGLEFQSQSTTVKHSTFDANGIQTFNEVNSYRINGIGIKGEFVFHPIIKDYLSIGLSVAYSIGTKLPSLPGDYYENYGYIEKNKFTYSKLNIGSELSFGFNPAKILLKANVSFQPVKFEKALSYTTGFSEKFFLDERLEQETVCAGFRFGRYATNNRKRGHSFDLYYIMSKNAVTNEISLKRLCPGLGFCWWIQSAIKLQFDVVVNTQQNHLKLFSINDRDLSYQVSFVYNRNWFY